MIISTFNANSIRSRAAIIKDWLAANQPDILCIQETKVQDQHFPAEEFETTGYEFVFRGMKAYNGVAIFSKQRIDDALFGLDSEPADQPRMITAQINGVTIVNTYIPQGFETSSDKFVYKLEWIQRLGNYFSNNFSPKDKIVWVGDFNVAMDQRDVYEPQRHWGHVCYNQEVIDRFNAIKDWGFQDMFRKFCPDGENYSFWDYRARGGVNRNMGWRLDYIMATQPMAKNCKRCWIDKAPRLLPKPSDHTFVSAEFEL